MLPSLLCRPLRRGVRRGRPLLPSIPLSLPLQPLSHPLTSGAKAGFATLRQWPRSSPSIVGRAERGMLGVPFLHAPDDFGKAVEMAKEVCEQWVQELTRRANTRFIPGGRPSDPVQYAAHLVESLHMLDAISNTLCKVCDPAEAIRNMALDTIWTRAAHDAYFTLTAYMHQLNVKKELYSITKECTEASPEVASHLTSEQRWMALMLRKEFERDGIHLSDDKRAAVVELNGELADLAAEYVACAGTPDTIMQIPQLWLKEPEIQPLLTSSAIVHLSKDTAKLQLSFGLRDRILGIARSEQLREAVLTASLAENRENVQRLEALRDMRTRLARLLGFNSYAEMVMPDRLAGSPRVAVAFLVQLSKAILPKAIDELYQLSLAKKLLEERRLNDHRISNLPPNADADAPLTLAAKLRAGRHVRVFQWDVMFLTKQLHPSLDISSLDTEPEHSSISSYFPWNSVLNGLELVSKRVFGVSLQHIQTYTREVSECTIMEFDLVHETDGYLGTMFVDPFARPGKFSGAAHFVLRCGKRGHPTDGALDLALNVGGSDNFGHRHQIPAIALLTSFGGRARNPSARSGGDTIESRCLSPSEVETLFHEFGHALNSLLSRTEFQHLSGTRGPIDFVELASHVTEYWARDYRVVKLFAKNLQGEVVPESLFVSWKTARRQFAALRLQHQICESLFDLALHGGATVVDEIISQGLHLQELLEDTAGNAKIEIVEGEDDIVIRLPDRLLGSPSPRQEGSLSSERDSKAWHKDSTRLMREIKLQYSLIPPVKGSAEQGTIGHYASYGAGYYTYLFASVFSAALWKRLFAHDPLSRSAGNKFRSEILQNGGALDAKLMLETALGGPPSLSALVEEIQSQNVV